MILFKRLRKELRILRLLEELNFEVKLLSYVIRQYRGTGLFTKTSQKAHDENVELRYIVLHQIKRLQTFYKNKYGETV